MSARTAFKKAWGEYRLDSVGPAYIADMAHASWDNLAAYEDGSVLAVAKSCAQRDKSATEVKPDGSIGPMRSDRAISLEAYRGMHRQRPAGTQCQYFD